MTEEKSLYEFTNDEEYEKALGEIDESDEYDESDESDNECEYGDNEPPYDDGELWDENKYTDFLEQNLKNGERYDIAHPD